MHALVVAFYVLIGLVIAAWGVAMYAASARLVHDVYFISRLVISGLGDMTRQLAETHAVLTQIGAHVVGVRATLESVVRVDHSPRQTPDLEPQLKGLTESVTILREAVETMRANPDDIKAQFNGIAESVDMLRRSAIAARHVEPPRVAAMEAPQVPTPHGEPKTLLLMNTDRTVAHRVTYHRDVPNTYAYGGRVFELLGLNDAGQWEFIPC